MERALAITILFLISLSAASALGIAQEFHPDQTLVLDPGASTVHNIILQNEENESITVNLTISGKVSTFDGATHLLLDLPARSFENIIEVQIDVPADTEPGTRIRENLRISPVSVEGGGVGMTFRINDHFDILVTPSEDTGMGFLAKLGIGALLVVVLALLLLLVMRKRSAGQQRR